MDKPQNRINMFESPNHNASLMLEIKRVEPSWVAFPQPVENSIGSLPEGHTPFSAHKLECSAHCEVVHKIIYHWLVRDCSDSARLI